MPFPFAAYSGYLPVYTSEYFKILLSRERRMSRKILWQICHKKKFSNRELTKIIVNMLRENRIKIKQAARDLDISVERARNWYYRNTGMTALDLLKMMQEYKFVRQAVESSLSLEFR
jgi:hypothetical protein